MASVVLQGTRFELNILPLDENADPHWAKTTIAIENEFVHYRETSTRVSMEELETVVLSLHRLLAGAYAQEYTVSAENAGLAFDLYPYTENGVAVERTLRREKDCVVAIRMLLRSETNGFLGGVYSILLHRTEIERFAKDLRREFDRAYAQLFDQNGKYYLVGLSPIGYKGCNYWYLDKTRTVQAGEYVVARMGRHNTEQLLYVDSVRTFNDDTLPVDLTRTRSVMRKATKEEILKITE